MGQSGRRRVKGCLGLVLGLSTLGATGCGDLASVGFAIRLLGLSLSGGASLGAASTRAPAPAPVAPPAPRVFPTWAPGPVIGWAPSAHGWIPVYGNGSSWSGSEVGPWTGKTSEGLVEGDQAEKAASRKEATGSEKGETAVETPEVTTGGTEAAKPDATLDRGRDPSTGGLVGALGSSSSNLADRVLAGGLHRDGSFGSGGLLGQ